MVRGGGEGGMGVTMFMKVLEHLELMSNQKSL